MSCQRFIDEFLEEHKGEHFKINDIGQFITIDCLESGMSFFGNRLSGYCEVFKNNHKEEMKILSTPSSFGINDFHDYQEGAIANISYSLLKSLATQDIEFHATIQSLRLNSPFPSNFHFYETGFGTLKLFNSYKIAKKILKSNKFDIICSPYFFYGVSFNPLKEIKDLPFIIGMCELPHKRYNDEVDNKYGTTLSKMGKKILFPLFQKTIDNCDKLIVVNKGAKDLYSKIMSNKKIEIIPYGVDSERFQYTSNPKNHNILIVSRLIKRRNIDKMINAMPLIIKEYPNTYLHIVGDGIQKENLQKLVKSQELGKYITFHNNVSPEELVSFYRSCHLFLSLSKEDGWNQSALEAMSSGRPVICYDAPHNSMVKDNYSGLCLSDLNDETISEEIMYLFDQEQITDKISEQARSYILKEHNWNKIGEEYHKVFRSVV